MFESEAKRRGFINETDLTGPLVQVKCQIRLIDYVDMSRRFELMGNIMPLINRLQTADSNIPKKEKRRATDEEKRQQAQFLDMSSVIGMIFGEDIYGIGYVDGSPKVSMQLQKDLLQSRSTGLFGESQEMFGEEWVVLGVSINKKKVPENKSESPVTDVVNQVSKALEGIRSQLYPVNDGVSLIPIAIYREIPSRGDKK